MLSEPEPTCIAMAAHIPDKHQAMTRYYGWYANRTRGE